MNSRNLWRPLPLLQIFSPFWSASWEWPAVFLWNEHLFSPFHCFTSGLTFSVFLSIAQHCGFLFLLFFPCLLVHLLSRNKTTAQFQETLREQRMGRVSVMASLFPNPSPTMERCSGGSEGAQGRDLSGRPWAAGMAILSLFFQNLNLLHIKNWQIELPVLQGPQTPVTVGRVPLVIVCPAPPPPPPDFLELARQLLDS